MCQPDCGDGDIVGTEVCDDGNDDVCGTCNNDCMSMKGTAKGPGYFASLSGSEYRDVDWEKEEGDSLKITDGMTEVQIRFINGGSRFTDIPFLGTDSSIAMAAKIVNVVTRLGAAGFGVSAVAGNLNKHYVKLYADADMSTGKAGFSVNTRLRELGVVVSSIPSGAYDCGEKTGCRQNADCESRLCCTSIDVSPACAKMQLNQCAPPDCNDSVRNGTETSMGCGGKACGRCDLGKFCVENEDCKSLVCCLESGKPQNSGCTTENPNTCLAARCGDGVQNQGETDTDCGGAACPGACRETQICDINERLPG